MPQPLPYRALIVQPSQGITHFDLSNILPKALSTRISTIPPKDIRSRAQSVRNRTRRIALSKRQTTVHTGRTSDHGGFARAGIRGEGAQRLLPAAVSRDLETGEAASGRTGAVPDVAFGGLTGAVGALSVGGAC